MDNGLGTVPGSRWGHLASHRADSGVLGEVLR